MTLFTSITHLHTFQNVYLKHGRKVTADDLVSLEDAFMLVDQRGQVSWTGTRLEWNEYAAGRTPAWRRKIKKVPLRGQTVLPAFTECHTHLLYAGSRADEFERRNRGDSYLAIAEAGGGIRSTVKATAAATLKELEAGVLSRLQEFARQGVTTVEIKTGYAATLAEEMRHLKLLVAIRKKASRVSSGLPRVVLTCLAAHSIPEGETETNWLEKVETLFPFLLREGIRLDIFIEKGAFSLVAGRSLLRKAVAKGLKLAVHADQLSLSGGTSLGVELGALSVDHVIEIGDAEIRKLARSETVAVLLPAADLYTRLPYPKARAMIDHGVRVALATDHNPGSSPGLDVAFTGLLARACMQMTLPEVLAAYTVNASHAVLAESKDAGGVLAKGHRADFICLRSGAALSDLFYEVGPNRSHAAIQSVWRSGVRIV
ncbi:MAG: imidazolonepropionase [Bdellovibrionales bacterium]|jgi:imidazolonepropionase|nr:imidazolonepropionase [Bdellovibrionales bacterium]